jgi:hypothetical protein
LQTVWTSAAWFDDEESLVQIFRVLGSIDWMKDGIFSFFPIETPLPAIKATLDDFCGEFDTIPFNIHFIDLETALNFHLE